jgi:hypothetical protein
MKPVSALCLCMAALFVTGCRGGKPAVEAVESPEDGAQDAAVDPRDAGSPGDEHGGGKSVTYVQDIAKLEMERVESGEALATTLSQWKLYGLLLDLVDDLSAAGPSGSFRKAADINMKALARLKEVRQGVGDDTLDMLNNVARRNLEAYASCMTVAKGDPSWCDTVEKAWKGSGRSCDVLYDIHVLIMGRAYVKNQPCGKVMAEARTMKGEEGVQLCEAVVRRDSDLCPWDESDPRGAYCAAAASKGNIKACDKVKIGWEEKKKRCCEIFAWRMSWMPSGLDGTAVPEAGALKGNEAGCMNALRWGLFESLALAFGVPLEGDHPAVEELNGEFLCPVLVYWTEREMTP